MYILHYASRPNVPPKCHSIARSNLIGGTIIIYNVTLITIHFLKLTAAFLTTTETNFTFLQTLPVIKNSRLLLLLLIMPFTLLTAAQMGHVADIAVIV